jgi:hypothetical protein
MHMRYWMVVAPGEIDNGRLAFGIKPTLYASEPHWATHSTVIPVDVDIPVEIDRGRMGWCGGEGGGNG